MNTLANLHPNPADCREISKARTIKKQGKAKPLLSASASCAKEEFAPGVTNARIRP